MYYQEPSFEQPIHRAGASGGAVALAPESLAVLPEAGGSIGAGVWIEDPASPAAPGWTVQAFERGAAEFSLEGYGEYVSLDLELLTDLNFLKVESASVPPRYYRRKDVAGDIWYCRWFDACDSGTFSSGTRFQWSGNSVWPATVPWITESRWGSVGGFDGGCGGMLDTPSVDSHEILGETVDSLLNSEWFAREATRTQLKIDPVPGCFPHDSIEDVFWNSHSAAPARETLSDEDTPCGAFVERSGIELLSWVAGGSAVAKPAPGEVSTATEVTWKLDPAGALYDVAADPRDWYGTQGQWRLTLTGLTVGGSYRYRWGRNTSDGVVWEDWVLLTAGSETEVIEWIVGCGLVVDAWEAEAIPLPRIWVPLDPLANLGDAGGAADPDGDGLGDLAGAGGAGDPMGEELATYPEAGGTETEGDNMGLDTLSRVGGRTEPDADTLTNLATVGGTVETGGPGLESLSVSGGADGDDGLGLDSLAAEGGAGPAGTDGLHTLSIEGGAGEPEVLPLHVLAAAGGVQFEAWPEYIPLALLPYRCVDWGTWADQYRCLPRYGLTLWDIPLVFEDKYLTFED